MDHAPHGRRQVDKQEHRHEEPGGGGRHAPRACARAGGTPQGARGVDAHTLRMGRPEAPAGGGGRGRGGDCAQARRLEVLRRLDARASPRGGGLRGRDRGHGGGIPALHAGKEHRDVPQHPPLCASRDVRRAARRRRLGESVEPHGQASRKQAQPQGALEGRDRAAAGRSRRGGGRVADAVPARRRNGAGPQGMLCADVGRHRPSGQEHTHRRLRRNGSRHRHEREPSRRPDADVRRRGARMRAGEHRGHAQAQVGRAGEDAVPDIRKGGHRDVRQDRGAQARFAGRVVHVPSMLVHRACREKRRLACGRQGDCRVQVRVCGQAVPASHRPPDEPREAAGAGGRRICRARLAARRDGRTAAARAGVQAGVRQDLRQDVPAGAAGRGGVMGLGVCFCILQCSRNTLPWPFRMHSRSCRAMAVHGARSRRRAGRHA